MITPATFPNYRVYETELGGRKLKFETGKMAGLANGAVLVTYGETVVLCTATMAKAPRDGIDFFPLGVDFEEKLYAVGRIPGSFMRREGRPGEKAILVSRLIDRQIRPFFPHDMRNDVNVMCTVMSVNFDDSAEVAAMLGASFALSISDIPWAGPICGLQMGYTEEEGYIVCPNSDQSKRSQLKLTVAGSMDKVVMIEAGADQFPDDMMLTAIAKAHSEIQKLVAFIANVQAEIGKEKASYPCMEVPSDMFEAVKGYAMNAVKEAVDTDDKTVRDERIDAITADV